MNKHIGIYVILNKANGKVYVGQSINLFDRLRVHKSSLRGNYHKNSHLQSSWNMYGEDSFEFLPLEFCDRDCLDYLEEWWIDYFNSMDNSFGYNKENGGNLNKKVSDETKEKIKKALSGKFSKENNFFYGKKRSLEMRLKSSNSQNNTGFYRVSKKKSPTSVQGYIWVYRWYDNDKRKAITSVDLIKLKEKVVDRGLPWIKLSDME